MDIQPGSAEMADFKLGTPALVCRWRLAYGRLPLENRHLRALSQRAVNGGPVSTQLIAWAKQHIEWTLTDGSATCPDGVLMLVVDDQGQAAMSVGPYEELGEKTAAALAVRAKQAAGEGCETGIAPELLMAVRGQGLVVGAAQGAKVCGAATLVLDLARAFGLEASRDEHLAEGLLANSPDAAPGDACAYDEVFLVSDEHGVVAATDCAGSVAERLHAAYVKLLDSMDKRQ